MTSQVNPNFPTLRDRTDDKPQYSRLWWDEGVFVEGADLNENTTRLEKKIKSVGDLLAADGDRLTGCNIDVNKLTGVVNLSEGTIYISGTPVYVPAAILTSVPMTGTVIIGVNRVTTIVTGADDQDLYGIADGEESEGEVTAYRQKDALTWARDIPVQGAVFYQIYTLVEGAVLDQTAPADLSNISRLIADEDYSAHRNYVVSGCSVSAIGLDAGAQVFSIEAGRARILGYPVDRFSDLTHRETEAPDLYTVSAEPRTYSGGASVVLAVNRAPISTVISVIVEKEITDTVTRGAVAGTQDALSKSSISSLIEVKQGATTYVVTASYLLSQDKVDWSPAGPEPAPGSSYTVKYRYLELVTQGVGGYTNTDKDITVYGGVTGGNVLLSYSSKMPRTDLLCLNRFGRSVYVKGIAARERPVAPVAPTELLPLAEIKNTWFGTPTITNRIITAIPFEQQKKYNDVVEDLVVLTGRLEGLERAMRRDPVAKKGVFADSFVDNRFRDEGIAQTAATFDEELVLAIDPTVTTFQSDDPYILNYTTEVRISQNFYTACEKINPFQNFTAPKSSLTLKPAFDFWTKDRTVFESATTKNLSTNVVPSAAQVETEIDFLPYLRPIAITFTIKKFLPGETLASLKFDDVSVLPVAPLIANSSGTVTGQFVIPAKIRAGKKRVVATGSAGGKCEAIFSGRGKVKTERITMLSISGNGNQDGNAKRDPQAQSFISEDGGFIHSVDLYFCAKGSVSDDVIVDIVEMTQAGPTQTIIGQAVVDMANVVVPGWHTCTLRFPAYTRPRTYYAIVVSTNSSVHSIGVAHLGQIDTLTGKAVTEQAYSKGDNYVGATNYGWLIRPAVDLAFRIRYCKFSPVTKTVTLGTVQLDQASDLIMKSDIDLANETTTAYYEIVRSNGDVITLANEQPYSFDSYVSDSVTVRAVLKGSAIMSPVIAPQITLVAGKIKSSGTYVTKAFKMGTGIKLSVNYEAYLPAGSSIVVQVDSADDQVENWVNVPFVSAEDLALQGWTDRKNLVDPFTAQQGRVRITLNGGPGSRPKAARLVASVI